MKPIYAFRFFFDWGDNSMCLWPSNDAARERFGLTPSIKDFSLSEETKSRVYQIGEWYQTALNWEYPPNPGPWRQTECDRFRQTVRILFDDLARELGSDYRLEYAQYEPTEDPDLDEYLKDPQNFRRKTSN